MIDVGTEEMRFGVATWVNRKLIRLQPVRSLARLMINESKIPLDATVGANLLADSIKIRQVSDLRDRIALADQARQNGRVRYRRLPDRESRVLASVEHQDADACPGKTGRGYRSGKSGAKNHYIVLRVFHVAPSAELSGYGEYRTLA